MKIYISVFELKMKTNEVVNKEMSFTQQPNSSKKIRIGILVSEPKDIAVITSPI